VRGVALKDDEILRYSRQILLPEIGGKGQKKIRQARVLCVGAGGLGSAAALYLAAAGVGTLGLADPETVEPSNLHRQVLHFTPDLGRLKTLSAQEKLRALNPHVSVEIHSTRLNESNVRNIFSRYDLVLDGSDNFETRYLANRTCVELKQPLVSGAVLQWQGQLMGYVPPDSACYQCLFPEPPDPSCVRSCSEAGLLGPVAGIVGCLQALEALKIILNRPGVLKDRLITFHFDTLSFRQIPFPKNAHCPACGQTSTVLQ